MDKMNITFAQYVNRLETTEVDHINANIDGVVVDVPLDPNNRHYQAIQEWVAEGNTIQEAD